MRYTTTVVLGIVGLFLIYSWDNNPKEIAVNSIDAAVAQPPISVIVNNHLRPQLPSIITMDEVTMQPTAVKIKLSSIVQHSIENANMNDEQIQAFLEIVHDTQKNLKTAQRAIVGPENSGDIAAQLIEMQNEMDRDIRKRLRKILRVEQMDKLSSVIRVHPFLIGLP